MSGGLWNGFQAINVASDWLKIIRIYDTSHLYYNSFYCFRNKLKRLFILLTVRLIRIPKENKRRLQ